MTNLLCKCNVYANAGYASRFQFIRTAFGGRRYKITPTIGRRTYAGEIKFATAIDTDILSAEEKAKALNSVNF